jgi:hypothetical protein
LQNSFYQKWSAEPNCSCFNLGEWIGRESSLLICLPPTNVLFCMYAIAATQMRFVWDEKKSRLNLAKHKVSFETAAFVFEILIPSAFSTGSKTEKSAGKPWGPRLALPCSLLLMPITWKAARK